jgi:YD repeat-containing protein
MRRTTRTSGLRRRTDVAPWRRAVAVLVGIATIGGCTSSDDGARIPGTIATVEVIAPGSCDSVGCVGEGIDTSTGAYTSTVEDLVFPVGLYGLELLRTYRSDRTEAGWFGPGWATVYETTLRTDAAGIVVDAPAGLAPRWRPEAPAGWTIDGGIRISAAAAGGHDLWWPSGERWSFDGDGRLSKMSSPYGHTVSIERVGANPTAIRSSQGSVLTMSTAGDRVVAVSADDGRTVDFTYDDGLLTGADAPGLSQRYRYNAEQRLLELEGPSGTTAMTYAAGKVAAQTTAGSQRFALTYVEGQTTVSASTTLVYSHDQDGRLTSVKQGDNVLEEREFDSEGRLVGAREFAHPGNHTVREITRRYEDGRLTRETTNGVETAFIYDDQGRLAALTSPVGDATFEYEGDTPLPSQATAPGVGQQDFEYTDGFITAVTDATGVQTVVERDGVGNPTSRAMSDEAAWSYSFDSEGNILTTVAPSGRTWSAEWAPRSTLLAEVDPLGRRSTYTYDAGKRLVRLSVPGGQVTHYNYGAAGRVTEEIRPDGLVTRYEYASDGTLTAAILPGERVWRTATEPLQGGGTRITVTAPDGSRTESSVDTVGRVFNRRTLEADGTLVEQRWFEFEFDRPTVTLIQRGNSRFQTQNKFNSAGQRAETAETLDGAEVGRTSYRYDDGKVIAASNATSEATYRYDNAGRLVEVSSDTDTWVATFDAGRLTATAHNNETTRISYDIDGRANSFVDPAGTTTTWVFDDADRPTNRSVGQTSSTFVWSASDQLIRYDAADGSTWSWEYDQAGVLASAAEPRGLLTTYEYEYGAVTRIQTEGADERDDRFEYNSRGLLQRGRTAAGDFSYEYDATGLPTRVDRDGDGNDAEAWTYDAQGNVTAVQAGSDAFDLSYDSRGRLQRITGAENRLDATWADENLAAVQTTERDPIRLVTDAQGRLTMVRWNEETVVDLDWSNDSTILQLSERGTDDIQRFGIDDDRLTSFDTDDIRVTSRHQPSGYLEALQLSTNDIEGNVRFDQLGRPATLVTSEAASTLSYDPLGRISSVLTSRAGESAEQTTVTYDGDDRKIDGDKRIVEALFTDDGALRSPLPSSLNNPASAAAGADNAALPDVAGTDTLLAAPEPRPLDEAARSVGQSTPGTIAPIGVEDLHQLAEQMAVAEVSRLAPTLKVNGETTVRLPIIDPENGHLADFNPFVDAAPSGLALGALSKQDGDDSLLERAQRTLGNIIGGALTIGGDIVRFIVTNPIARLVVTGGTWVVAAALCAAGAAACIPVASVAALLTTADGATNLATSGVAAAQACSDGALAACGLSLIGATLAVLQIAAGAVVGTQLLAVRAAGKALSGAMETRIGVAHASSRAGTAKSDALATLRLEKVIAREVPVCAKQTCARFDSVTKDVFGRLRAVESKNGTGARFTPNQKVVYPALRSEGGYLPYQLRGGSPRCGSAGWMSSTGARESGTLIWPHLVVVSAV